jgi:hypothetical protein
MAKRASTVPITPPAPRPDWTSDDLAQPDVIAGIPGPGRWLAFVYEPTALFSLKTSRATSTVGKTLLTPTPYAAKMAFVDAALRHGLTDDPDALVRWLSVAQLRIGLPEEACVTGTIQKVRQESRAEDRKKNPEIPPYKPTIALREIVHYWGSMVLAFDLATCVHGLAELLVRAAAAVNYLGKRGSFLQFSACRRRLTLDASFTQPVDRFDGELPAACHLAILDDFGPGATFEALNTFSAARVVRGVHRVFVETVVPLGVQNVGPGYVQYSALRGR